MTIANSRDHVDDTIRHEIAHALDYIDRGRSDHSVKWKRWAKLCGARPERCISSGAALPEAPHFMYCPSCGRFTPRYRKIKADTLCSCKICSDSFSFDYPLISKVLPNQKKRIELGEIRWNELQQAEDLVATLDRMGLKGLYQKRYRNVEDR